MEVEHQKTRIRSREESASKEADSQSTGKKMRPNDPIGNILKGVKCDSTLFPSAFNTGPITVQPEDSIESAFKKLIDNRILAVPVVTKDQKIKSVLSMIDLLNVIVDNFSEEELRGMETATKEVWEQLYGQFLNKKDAVVQSKVQEVLQRKVEEFHFLDPVVTIKSHQPLADAVQLMVANRCHRVVVVDNEDKFVNFITQSRVLKVLSTVFGAVPEAHRSILELGIAGIAIKDVAHISDKERAFQAFRLMRKKNVSGVAVIDEHGHVAGNISVNDLKLLEFDLKFLNMLGLPVKEYLEVLNEPQTVHQECTSVRISSLRRFLKNNASRPVLTCSLDDTLAGVVCTMNHYNVHRIFVENELGKPIGVLSMLDLLMVLVNLKKITAM